MKHTYLLALALLPGVAAAQHTQGASAVDENIQVVEGRDTTDFYVTLHKNAPQLANIPDVPRFAIMGKEKKFYLGLGANIMAEGVYDAGDVISNQNMFTTSAIPVNPAPGNGGQFRFTAQQSGIYLNMVALPGSKDQIGAFVAFNFLGNNNNYGFNLEHAYLKYRGFTAGYTHTIFFDGQAAPATIDWEGPNAETSITVGMLAYQKEFGKDNGWKAGIAIQTPQNSYTNSDNTSTVSQRLPDIPFYIQRNWAGGNGWLRVSAMIRNLYYRDNVAGHNVDKVGWGIKASGTTPIAGGLSASYMGLYGKGIGSYIQDINGMGFDLMPNPNDPGRLEAVKAWSTYGSLRYQFSPKVFCSATYSHVRAYAPDYKGTSTPWGSNYKYGQYVVGNVFYNVNSMVQLGAEYLWGRRVDNNGMQGHDNRIEAMMQVSF